MVSIAMTILMAACSQENVEDNQASQNLITFSVPDMLWNKANTRAQVLGSIEDLKASTTEIRVTAKIHTDHSKVYINNERLQYLNNTWTLSKYVNNAWIASKYYWLPNTPLDFFADVVSGNRTAFNSQVSNQTNYTFDYTVPTTIANQHDYVYAVSLNTQKSDDPIPLDFRHALSQIVFTASVAENWYVEIKSITIHNISSTGTFSYETGLWTNLNAASTDYVFQLASAETFNGISAARRLQATDDERLVLMPQTLDSWSPKVGGVRVPIATADAQNKSYVAIECKIKHPSEANYYAGTNTTYGTIYAPISGTWEPNKIYIYELPFGYGYNADGKPTIEQITLSTTILDWTTGEIQSGNAEFD